MYVNYKLHWNGLAVKIVPVVWFLVFTAPRGRKTHGQQSLTGLSIILIAIILYTFKLMFIVKRRSAVPPRFN